MKTLLICLSLTVCAAPAFAGECAHWFSWPCGITPATIPLAPVASASAAAAASARTRVTTTGNLTNGIEERNKCVSGANWQRYCY
jgi:hypothetical protein